MNAPVVIGSWPLLGRFGMHIHALPVTFLINLDGRIASRNPGMVNRNEFEAETRKLLDAPSSTQYRCAPHFGGEAEEERSNHHDPEDFKVERCSVADECGGEPPHQRFARCRLSPVGPHPTRR